MQHKSYNDYMNNRYKILIKKSICACISLMKQNYPIRTYDFGRGLEITGINRKISLHRPLMFGTHPLEYMLVSHGQYNVTIGAPLHYLHYVASKAVECIIGFPDWTLFNDGLSGISYDSKIYGDKRAIPNNIGYMLRFACLQKTTNKPIVTWVENYFREEWSNAVIKSNVDLNKAKTSFMV